MWRKPLRSSRLQELNVWKRKEFDWISEQLGIAKQEDWYTLTPNTIRKHHLLQENGSLFASLQKVYPEFEWNPMLFSVVHKRDAKIKSNQRFLMDYIAEQLGIDTQKQWYSVKRRQLRIIGGFKVLRLYNYSMYNTLQSVYPEFSWNSYLFGGFKQWQSKDNQRKMFDWISEQLGIDTQYEWYSVTMNELKSVGIRIHGLINHYYNSSLFTALKSIYSEFEWNPILSNSVPLHHWQVKQHHREMMDWIGELCEIETQEQWYSITGVEVKRHGGGAMLEGHYGGSLFTALSSIYSEFEWNPMSFQSVPLQFQEQKKKENHRNFFDKLSEMLEISTQQDWYEVTAAKVKSMDGSGTLNQYNGSLCTALQHVYPEYDWNPLLFVALPSTHLKTIEPNLIKESLNNSGFASIL